MPDGKESGSGPAPAFTLESAFRSVQPSARPEDIEALIRDAKEEKAERTLQKLEETRSEPSPGPATAC